MAAIQLGLDSTRRPRIRIRCWELIYGLRLLAAKAARQLWTYAVPTDIMWGDMDIAFWPPWRPSSSGLSWPGPGRPRALRGRSGPCRAQCPETTGRCRLGSCPLVSHGLLSSSSLGLCERVPGLGALWQLRIPEVGRHHVVTVGVPYVPVKILVVAREGLRGEVGLQQRRGPNDEAHDFLLPRARGRCKCTVAQRA